VREARVVHVEDLTKADDFPVGRDFARRGEWRTTLSAPLLRESVAIGAILICRSEVRPFTEKQVALLQTFADQAVIAIENVRLFTELGASNRDLTEALEQQTAASEVLRAISGSTFDLAPVLQTLVENATRLCNARHGYIFKFDGEFLHPAADYGASPEFTDYWRQNPIRPGPNSTSGRAALERRTVHIHDVTAEPGYQYLGVQSQEGFRTVLAVPMLREDTLLGVITLWKTRVEPFSNRQIKLVTSFADQAVIAIENVRLFTELQARTGQLTRSVEELRALGEVGQALSSTLDLETVLTTIVERAVVLSAADSGSILEYDETAEQFYLRVSNEDDEVIAALRGTPLRKGEGATGRMALTREPVQIPDIVVQGAYESRVREALLRSERRALLAVPLLSEEHIIGGLVITRNAAGEFPTEVVELLRTFATQSALAIQNARLFHEIEGKSRELETASRHKSEFLANMSHELRTPLNAILGFSEVLAAGMFGEINDKQAEYLHDIQESGRHLLSLINDILDLSKIEAGRMDLESTDFDLPSAIDNALALVRERAGRRGVSLGRDIDGRVGMICGDERKVKQVLLNLLSNAIKFTPEGGRIDVRAAVRDGKVEVSVADTGVGIAPEDQETVFEEFRQVGTADKKVEGTGLGLALSRKFVGLHGGRIWVKSQVGQGSTFTFAIPASVSR
jgi:signal transduction histidine kinase